MVALVARALVLITLASRVVLFGVLLGSSDPQLTGMAVLHPRSAAIAHKQTFRKQFHQLVRAVTLDQAQVAHTHWVVIVGSQTGETCKDKLS